MLPELEHLPDTHRSGFVAVVGRPNVGKSTLLNRVLQQKIAITSPKPQTTRDRLMGIFTADDAQIIFLDTPGIHKPHNKLGEYMVSVAESTIRDADVVLWLVDISVPPTAADRHIAELLRSLHGRNAIDALLLGMNKVDQLSENAAPEVLDERIDEYLALVDWLPGSAHAGGARSEGAATEEPEMSVLGIHVLSALNGRGVNGLLTDLAQRLPLGPQFYPSDQVTDLQVRFITEELIREKALSLLEQEVPHSIAVIVDEFTPRSEEMTYISAVIYVERESQKKIVLGRGGSMIKKIGQQARPEIEELVGTRVYLELWVKVWEKWRKRTDMLQRLGYAAQK